MELSDFLYELYGDNLPGHLVIWTAENKRSEWFDDLDKASIRIKTLAKTKNVYFGLGLQDSQGALELAREIAEKKQSKKKVSLSNTRGFADTTLAIPGFWLDIDIKGPNHKQDNLPETIEEAKELTAAFPLPPTLMIHTGGGLHAYWLFKELWEFEDKEEREQAKSLSQRFQYSLQVAGKKRGWETDSTYDLSRVLRPPETYNRKGEPVPVKVIEFNESNRYNPEDFDGYLLEIPEVNTKEGKKVDPASILQGVPEGSRDNTLFKYASSLRARGVTREEAEALILMAARNCNPPFPDDEAITKVDSAWKYPAGGTEEQTLEEAKNKIINLLKDFEPEDIFEEEVVGALAVIKDLQPVEYAKIKQKLKGNVNTNDIERLVNLRLAENRNIHVVQPDEKPPGLNQVLPDFPLENLITPGDWSIDQRGVRRYDAQKNIMIRACMVPAILTERLINIENEKEKMTVSYYRYKKWHSITASSSTLFNHSSIVQLRDRGLPVSSTDAKEMVKYLTDFESANLNLLPVKQSIHHFGWIREGQAFLPGAGGDIVLDIDDDGSSSIAQHYHPSGELEDWIKAVKPLREYPVARFILAAGFASPLMSLIGQRVFLLHCWGGSRGGKTAAMKAAVSVWGNPEAIMASFNATKTGLENMASLYSDLPLLIDERQVAGKNQEEIETLVYTLSMGKSKARGNKGGGLQQFASWKSIILMNGEHPLTNQSSATGVRTRTLELYGRVIPDEEYAGNLHRLLEKYYGTAGPEFITRVIEELKANPNVFEDDYNLIYQALKDKFSDKAASHLAYVSTVIIGDYYSSIWIFGLDEEEAFKQAIELGSHILQQLDSSEDMNEAARAYEYVLSWYKVNEAFFKEDPPGGRRYGLGETDGYLWIYPLIFNEAMDSAGFNHDRILRDWADMGLIQTTIEKKTNKRRFKRKKYAGNNKQPWFVSIRLNNDSQENLF